MGLNYKDYRDGGLLQDRYLKVGDISEGSFGIVTLAKDTKANDTLVAVKYITQDPSDFKFKHRPEISQDGGEDHEKKNVAHTYNMSVVLEEARQEIAILKKLGSHANITELYDSFDSYLILEYCVRGDLYDAIRNGYGPGTTRDILDVVGQLINAVEYAHGLGVYHRDIKPENILITEDWTIKLTDWGLASTERYCTDFDVGSERYMAPELLDHKDVDCYDAEKVDLWSTGICLLNIVFGKNPFASATDKDRVFLHFAANRETLFDIFPSMSYDLFAVLKFALALDPDNRNLPLMKEELAKVEHVTVDFDIEEYLRKSEEEDEIHQPEEAQKENTLERDASKSVPEVTITKTPSSKKYNFRGERKPLAIPSSFHRNNRNFYNDENNGRRFDFNNSKTFKRQDFFTPKSMFKHYLDNADKHREAVRSSNVFSSKSKPAPNGGDKRAWRKGKSGYRPRNSNNYHNGGGHFKTPEQKTTKSPYSGRLRSSSSSRQGLYVSPNLRSPVLAMNSPLSRPVRDDSPELEDIPSDRDDELFILDDDFSKDVHHSINVPATGHQQHDQQHDQQHYQQHDQQSRWTKKYGKKEENGQAMYPSLLLPSFISPMKTTSAATTVSASSSQTTATTVSGALGKHDIFGSELSSIVTNATDNSSNVVVSSSAGKKPGVYIPPHHRQGHSFRKGNQPVRRSFNSRADALLSSSSSGHNNNNGKQGCGRLLNAEAATTITTPMKNNPNTTVSSSVPAMGTDYWFNHYINTDADWLELDDDDFDTSNDNDDFDDDNLDTTTTTTTATSKFADHKLENNNRDIKGEESVTVFDVADNELEIDSIRHPYRKTYGVA